jgi:RNA polymerase primary sigma factor
MDTMTKPTEKVSRCKKHEPEIIPPTDKDLAAMDPQDAELLLRAIREPIEYVDHAAFRSRQAETTLFGQQTESFLSGLGSPASAPMFIPQSDLDASARTATVSLTTQQEQQLFQQYNFARREIYCALKAGKGKKLSPDGMQHLLKWLKIASASRAHIVQANMPLVLAMAKRSKITSVDFADMISEGNMALLRSVEKFDCSKGFKFSTYACRAILKSFSRVAIKAGRYRSHFPTEYDPAMEKSDFIDKKRHEVEESCVDELRAVLADNLAELNDVERKVIQARFALNAADPEQARPLTLEEVGGIIGVTKERVRQIQNKALEKLRQSLEDSILAA